MQLVLNGISYDRFSVLWMLVKKSVGSVEIEAQFSPTRPSSASSWVKVIPSTALYCWNDVENDVKVPGVMNPINLAAEVLAERYAQSL